MSWINTLLLRFPNVPRKKISNNIYSIRCPFHKPRKNKNILPMILDARKNLFTCLECGIFGHKQFLKDKLTISAYLSAQKDYENEVEVVTVKKKVDIFKLKETKSDSGIFRYTNQIKN
tara:strand:+ start:196 stop:549 length:354 start_codon:yes stop_codon:yes gene_type:complete